jgi:hypothetical protein
LQELTGVEGNCRAGQAAMDKMVGELQSRLQVKIKTLQFSPRAEDYFKKTLFL